jgi:hypothetical protein
MERDKKLAKHEIKITKKECNLDKTICSPTAKYTDYYIDGVTYRVWSAFEGGKLQRKKVFEILCFADWNQART